MNKVRPSPNRCAFTALGDLVSGFVVLTTAEFVFLLVAPEFVFLLVTVELPELFLLSLLLTGLGLR